MRFRTSARNRQTVSQRAARQKTGERPVGRRTGMKPAGRRAGMRQAGQGVKKPAGNKIAGKLPAAGPAMKLKRPPRLPKRIPAEVAPPAGPAEKPVPVQPPESVRAPVQHLDLNKEKTVTVKEAAYRLRKSVDAVRLWLRSGRLRGWQPGGRGCAILVTEASIAEALCYPLGGNGNGLHLPAQRSELTPSITS